MLTIGQLARYAGVTARAVRHYHQIGLLPEPGRDRAGYRTYDAAAVVRLIRIHTLAEAGVPLARVQDLLDADPREFARDVEEIDAQLGREVWRLEATRERLARLAAGEHLALPPSVVDYLDTVRGLGVDERYVEMERDAWIMVAAQVPDEIDAIMAKKHRELDDPDMQRLHLLLSEGLDWDADDPRVVEVVDVLERLMIRAVEAGEVDDAWHDDAFVDLLDSATAQASPVAERMLAILQERGWKGWTRIERVPADRVASREGTASLIGCPPRAP